MSEGGIRITILGSGTCVPSLARSSCAVQMAAAGQRVLFDCGPGTMRRLLEAGSSIFHVDLLALSHFHPDHSGELGPLLFAGKYGRREPGGPMLLAGGRGLEAFYRGLRGAWGDWIDPGPEALQTVEMATDGPDSLSLGPLRLHSIPVDHNPESLAFRLETPSGRSAVYSGDTDFSRHLIDLSRGADLLICECALPDAHRARGHLTPSLAGDIARQAGVGHLVLTHFYPECEDADIRGECRRVWDGPLTLAEDLMEIGI